MRNALTVGLVGLTLTAGCSINMFVADSPPAGRAVDDYRSAGDFETTAVAPQRSLDRAEPAPLPEWWSNGDQLLHLKPNGAYRLYYGADRRHAPVERGRWLQQSSATIAITPYDVFTYNSTRMTVSGTGADRVMKVRHLEPLSPLDDGPPMDG